MSQWTVCATPFDDPAASRLRWDYQVEMTERWFTRPATDPADVRLSTEAATNPADVRFSAEAATDAEIAQYLRDNPDDIFSPPDGVFLVAHHDGEPAGCAGLVRTGPRIGELGRLFVRPGFRRGGGGAALLAAAEDYARRLGIDVIRLDTRHDLIEARRLYAGHGYQEIPAFNADPYAERWFGKPLT